MRKWQYYIKQIIESMFSVNLIRLQCETVRIESYSAIDQGTDDDNVEGFGISPNFFINSADFNFRIFFNTC